MKDGAYETAINPKYDGYQTGLASMDHKLFETENRIEGKCKKRASSRITQAGDSRI